MITISGVSENDRMRVARALVRTLGIGGVCSKEPKCRYMGCGDCADCAANNYVVFTDDCKETK
jgi:hypothetical protein